MTDTLHYHGYLPTPRTRAELQEAEDYLRSLGATQADIDAALRIPRACIAQQGAD